MSDQKTTADNKIEMHKLIGKQIGTMWGGLAQSSIENFLQTSRVSGSFLTALETMMQEYASLQTAEQQKEIDRLTGKSLEDVNIIAKSSFQFIYKDTINLNQHINFFGTPDQLRAIANHIESLK